MKIVRNFVTFFLVLFSLFFTSLSFTYYSDKYYALIIDLSAKYPYFHKPVQYLDKFYNEIDLNKFFKKSKLPENKIIRLQLTGSDVKDIQRQIEKFKKIGFIKDEYNNWRNAKILVKNKQEKIKYKFHGTSLSPLINFDSFSLRIKHKKTGNYLDSMREFSLITFKDDLDTSTISINKIASDYGLLSPHGKMVILKINNITIGQFMMVEHHDKEWFEKRHQITNFTMLKSNDDWDRKENTSGSAHISESDKVIENKEFKTTSLQYDVAIGALDNLLRFVDEKNIIGIKSLIDQDYAARFLALNVLANNSHPLTGDNLRYVYDHTRGNFKFIFRIEDTIKPIKKSLIDFNSSWFTSYPYYSSNMDLFKILIQDSSFRNLRDKYLIELVRDKKSIMKMARNTYTDNYQVQLSSNSSLRRYNFNKKNYLQTISENIDKISNYLNYSKVFITIENDFNNSGKRKIRVLNDGFVPLNLKEIVLESPDLENIKKLDNFLIESPDLNDKLKEIRAIQTVYLESNKKIKKISLLNKITNKPVSNDDIYINHLKNLDISLTKDNLDILIKNNIIFEVKNNELHIKKGNYKINEDIIFPSHLPIVINSGTVFLISPKKTILFKSNLTLKGTSFDPIIVKRLDQESPFGTMAIIGKTKKIDVKISNLHIEGGSEGFLGGVTFLGQLSIHNANVSMQDSLIKNSSSDDGMNIRNSSILIENSTFIDNFADQVDLDFCTGEVSNNSFIISNQNKSRLRDSNGDGLDLSGSKVNLNKNTFTNFADKGVSIGENSNILAIKNSFFDNSSAMTVKDGSSLYSISNIFKSNNFDYSIYIKKRFYEAPKIMLSPLSKTNLPKINNLLENQFGSISVASKKELISEYESK